MSRLFEITKEEMARAEPGAWGEANARIDSFRRYILELEATLAELEKKYKKHQEYEPLLDVVECLSTENTKKVEALALALLREQDALHAEGDS